MRGNSTSSLRRKPLQALAAIVFLNAFSTGAFACPFCHTETGKQIRSGVFGSDFRFNLIVTIIPFVIFLGITALIYFGFPTRGSRSKHNESPAFKSGSYPKGETF
jgi:hypothetical protein